MSFKVIFCEGLLLDLVLRCLGVLSGIVCFGKTEQRIDTLVDPKKKREKRKDNVKSQESRVAKKTSEGIEPRLFEPQSAEVTDVPTQPLHRRQQQHAHKSNHMQWMTSRVAKSNQLELPKRTRLNVTHQIPEVKHKIVLILEEVSTTKKKSFIKVIQTLRRSQ